MRNRVEMPSSLVEDAHAYARGEREVSTPRDAATVMLLRDGSDGIEVYLLRRQQTMAFAAGMYVFPGGRVDARDADTAVGWAGPAANEWGVRLDCDPEVARALVCAAVRETFEESGVLLAGSDPTSVVDDTTGAGWETDRVALERRDFTFSEFLERRGLVLRSDLLGAWSHWITPEFEPRRYDTRFFVAGLPAGQRTRDVSGEADHVMWQRPVVALEQMEAGEIAMMPPTYVTLRELCDLSSSADGLAVAAKRRISPVLPRLVVDDGAVFLDAELA